jgi:hypothetical protein
MNKYYVLHISEDGDVYFNEKTKEELENDINKGSLETNFFEKVNGGDVMEGGAGTYIIKGELVVPQNKEIVTRRELP